MAVNIFLAAIVGVFTAYHTYLYLVHRARPTDSEWTSRLSYFNSDDNNN